MYVYTQIPPHIACMPEFGFKILRRLLLLSRGKVVLEVNPSVLVGSFLAGILPYGLFSWKPWGAGTPSKIGWGCANPCLIYDQNLQFSLPYLWADQKFNTL